MTKLRVFPDTGVLLAMMVFPKDQYGQPTLAGEVLDLYEEDVFDLIFSQAVIDELEEVIDRDFPEFRSQILALLAPFKGQLTRWPMPQEIKAALLYATDPDDAPIFAAAVVAQPDIVVSNDFQAFHTPRAKEFWAQYQIQVESLYGLLCVFGRRERKD